MKKIILVPHTHWDREWYFTDQTSAILLERMRHDISSQKNKFPFNLDGQASLAEELSGNINTSDYLSKNNITAGPLFIQQDTFNVMIGTTINNLEIGKKVLGNTTLKTVYMPDTFGFNEQLPQIFKHYKFKNFVAWRGIKVEDKKKSNFFKWEGIDGTKINASYMAEGYYCLGQYFPYNQEKKYTKFSEEVLKYVKLLESREKNDVYWVPLGGDQAPYEKDVINAVKHFNNKYKDYQLVLGTHDDYFNEIKKNNSKLIHGKLDYSGTSKIHRTIHSNRYDIKKTFRDAEKLIYYTMEPLEIIFKKMGGKLLENEFKDKFIYKELLKSSAHDSLGGCNLDKTNSQILSRNERVIDLVKTYIDSIKRDIKEMLNLSTNEYLVFNLSPFKRDVSFQDIISTSSENYIGSKDGSIIEYMQEDISWKQHEQTFNHYISIFSKNMAPLSYKIFNLEEIKKQENTPISIDLNIKVENDLGDEFDFAYDKASKPLYFNDFKHIKTVGKDFHKVSEYSLNKLNINLLVIKNSHGKQLKVKINNKFKNKRISLVFNRRGLIKLSRHLAFVTQNLDYIENWKEKGYKDEPVNFYTNDGLIINGNTNILTAGTNEVFINEDELELTLYRSVGFLGKPDISTRPGAASGLPMKCPTYDSQLNKELFFDIAINNFNSTSALNNWNFVSIGQFGGNVNPILNNVERFVWNKNKKLKPHFIKIKDYEIERYLIGRFKNISNKIELVFTDQKSKNRKKIIWVKK